MKWKEIVKHAIPALLAAALVAAACGQPESEQERPPAQELQAFDPEAPAAAQASVFPNAPSPRVRSAVREAALEVEEGEATFYADTFEGRRTASGETFRHKNMVAAHRAFPFGTRLRVTNARNDKEVEVRVVDRGPFTSGLELAPVLDLSRAAAERLDFIGEGRAQVRIEVVEWGP